jgi:hypothetical protein
MLSLDRRAPAAFSNLHFVSVQLFDEQPHLPLPSDRGRGFDHGGGLVTHHSSLDHFL